MSSTSQKLDEIIRLELPATLRYLNVLGACLTAMLAQVDSLEELDVLSYTVQLGVHEICTNIVQHAYKQEHEEPRIAITMELKMHPRRLCITLFDTGSMCDLSSVEEPNLDDVQVHGYGLFLARNVLDEVIYSRQPEGNYWRLAKVL